MAEHDGFYIPPAQIEADGRGDYLKIPIYLDAERPMEHLMTVLDCHQATCTEHSYSGRVVLSIAGDGIRPGTGAEQRFAAIIERINATAAGAGMTTADGHPVVFEVGIGELRTPL